MILLCFRVFVESLRSISTSLDVYFLLCSIGNFYHIVLLNPPAAAPREGTVLFSTLPPTEIREKNNNNCYRHFRLQIETPTSATSGGSRTGRLFHTTSTGLRPLSRLGLQEHFLKHQLRNNRLVTTTSRFTSTFSVFDICDQESDTTNAGWKFTLPGLVLSRIFLISYTVQAHRPNQIINKFNSPQLHVFSTELWCLFLSNNVLTRANIQRSLKLLVHSFGLSTVALDSFFTFLSLRVLHQRQMYTFSCCPLEQQNLTRFCCRLKCGAFLCSYSVVLLRLLSGQHDNFIIHNTVRWISNVFVSEFPIETNFRL